MFIGLGISVNTKASAGNGPTPPPLGYERFVPLGATGMITVDGKTFNSKE